MSGPAPFTLRKWYLDVVEEGGAAFIGYAATLQWKGLSVAYHGALRAGAEGGIARRNSFRAAPMPVAEDGALRWKAPGLEGAWRATSEPLEEVLYQVPEGRVLWRARPRAEATVKVGKDVLQGLGYTECIELTLPPWDLPLRELRWGRFLSAHHHVVWIQWLGPAPRLLIHHNGARHEQGEISEAGLVFGDVRLALSGSLSLRAGALLSTVFARAPWLRKAFPLSILRLDERKWRSRGRLLQGGNGAEEGWAIHETVRWT